MALRIRTMFAVAICIAAVAAFCIFWTRSQDARAPSVPDDDRAENGERGKVGRDAPATPTPKSQDAAFYYNRGNEWYQKNDFDQAVADYTKAIRLNPNDALALSNRGLAWRNKGETDKAIIDFDEAVRLDPLNAGFFFNRGNAWFRKREYDKALADYTEAIGLNPQFSVAYLNRGESWKNKGELDKAIADFTEATRIDPTNAPCFYNRGNAWFRKGEYDKAIADFTEVVRLDPKDATVLYNRGIAWTEKKEYEKALTDYAAGVSLDPKFNYFYDRRAWLLASCPVRQYRNGPEAVQDATRACELSNWKSSTSVRILGAAYAEAGDFPQAVKWLTKAMAMDGHERELRRKMLALFEAGKPYRDDVPVATED